MDWTGQKRTNRHRLIKRRQLKRGLLRASSYEPGNRAGSITGSNSVVVCSYGNRNFSPVDRDEFRKQPKWWNINLYRLRLS